jgi:hypothetical protein
VVFSDRLLRSLPEDKRGPKGPRPQAESGAERRRVGPCPAPGSVRVGGVAEVLPDRVGCAAETKRGPGVHGSEPSGGRVQVVYGKRSPDPDCGTFARLSEGLRACRPGGDGWRSTCWADWLAAPAARRSLASAAPATGATSTAGRRAPSSPAAPACAAPGGATARAPRAASTTATASAPAAGGAARRSAWGITLPPTAGSPPGCSPPPRRLPPMLRSRPPLPRPGTVSCAGSPCASLPSPAASPAPQRRSARRPLDEGRA